MLRQYKNYLETFLRCLKVPSLLYWYHLRLFETLIDSLMPIIRDVYQAKNVEFEYCQVLKSPVRAKSSSSIITRKFWGSINNPCWAWQTRQNLNLLSSLGVPEPLSSLSLFPLCLSFSISLKNRVKLSLSSSLWAYHWEKWKKDD